MKREPLKTSAPTQCYARFPPPRDGEIQPRFPRVTFSSMLGFGAVSKKRGVFDLLCRKRTKLPILPCPTRTPFLYSHGEDVQGVHGAAHHLEVVLEDGDGAGQGLVSAAAEQSHAHVQQDGGDEGWVRDPAQAFDAAFEAS